MFKKIVVFSFVLACICQSVFGAVHTNESIQVDCQPSLRPALAKICQIPEAKSLINKIQAEGAIHIKMQANSLASQFGACWDPFQRSIFLAQGITEGQQIGFMLFELHNAAASSKFQFLEHLVAQRIIDKETYIKAVERVEYENSLKTAKISSKGINLNIFPRDAYLSTYKSFDEYYYFQKLAGHSAALEKNYQNIISNVKS